MREQHASLCAKVRGHYAYFGITGNGRCLGRLKRFVERTWRRWLGRRSDTPMTRAHFARIQERYPLPIPRIMHSYSRRSANPWI